jgi:hypothetical protein
VVAMLSSVHRLLLTLQLRSRRLTTRKLCASCTACWLSTRASVRSWMSS